MSKKNSYKYSNLNLTGCKFHHLTVVGKSANGRSRWICKCDCGKTVEYPTFKVLANKSCGCLEKENKLNIGKRTRKHGATNTRLYAIWCGIKDRCNNPNLEHFDRYGGRGINICKEWQDSFDSFCEWATANGYNDHKSIDRIDVNGNYEPSNCRWATVIEQARNKENTVFVTYKDGHKESARKFAENNNISDYVYVFRHVKKGEFAEDILRGWIMLHDTPKNYLSVEEMADLYCVTPQTIKNRIKKGMITAEKYGKKWYIPKTENRKNDSK